MSTVTPEINRKKNKDLSEKCQPPQTPGTWISGKSRPADLACGDIPGWPWLYKNPYKDDCADGQCRHG